MDAAPGVVLSDAGHGYPADESLPMALAAMVDRPADPAERIAGLVATPEEPTLEDLAGVVEEIAEAEARVAVLSGQLVVRVERARRIAAMISRDVLVDTEAAAKATRSEGRRGSLAEWVENLAARGLATELGALLQISSQSAAGLIGDAEILTSVGARVLDEMLDGRISLAHARAMASQLAGLDADVADNVTGEVMNLPAADDDTPPEQVFSGGVLSPGQVRNRARVAREKHHREPLDTRCRKAAEDRYVRLDEVGDGMAYLEAFLPSVTAHAIDDRLQTTARHARKQGDPRTRTQLRADTLADLLLAETADEIAAPASATSAGTASASTGGTAFAGGPAPGIPDGLDRVARARAARVRAAEGGRPVVPVTGDGVPAGTAETDRALVCTVHDHDDRPAAGRAGDDGPDQELDHDSEAGCVPLVPLARSIRPVVHVTVPLLRLLGRIGIDVGDERLDPGAGPAMLDGHVPIDDETAARLIAQAPSLRRLLTDPETGAVVSVGRNSYVVPADLREYLRIRDVTCRWPGCSARAVRCDVDHATDWAAGGRTDHDNLVHLCRAHHIVKHQTRWTSRLAADGTVTWTSPTGRSYTTHPQERMTTGRETARSDTTRSHTRSTSPRARRR